MDSHIHRKDLLGFCDCVGSVDQFWRNDIFAVMNLLVHNHDVSHHLFVASLTSLNFIMWFFSVDAFHISHCLYPLVFGGSFDAIVNGIIL